MSDKELFGQNDLPWKRGLDPDTIIGWVVDQKYKISWYLGGGGFGEVYAARNIRLIEQRVVIKFLKQIESRKRFEKEAKILCQLDHPNICRIIDYLPNEGALIMQFIDGMNCEKYIERYGLFNENMILKIALSLTSAIAYAHKRNIAHRDIKPQNIMVDHNQQVYLIDFGIAKELGSTVLTGTGIMVLTPSFAAPERLYGGGKYDPFLSDIYEIGATIQKLAIGETPYEARNMPKSITHGNQKSPGLSYKMKRIIKKATQTNPEDRYRTAEDLSSDLRKVNRVYRRPRWIGVSVIVLFVTMLATIWINNGSIKSKLSKYIKNISQAIVQDNSIDTTEHDEQAFVSKDINEISQTIVQGDTLDTALHDESAIESKEIGKKMVVVADSTTIAQQYVNIKLSTIPNNAIIYIDGMKIGKSPIDTSYLSGNYPIRIEKKWYLTYEDYIEIKLRNTVREYRLNPDFGAVDVTSSPENGLDIYLDGVAQNKKTPSIIDTLSPKNYTIFAKSQFFETDTVAVSVQRGIIHKIELIIKGSYAVLNIDTYEGATVSINGQEISQWKNIRLKPQTVVVSAKLKLPEIESVNKNIDLKTGDTVSISLFPSTMTFVEGGELIINLLDSSNKRNEDNILKVNDFFISRFETTQFEYKKIMGDNPSYFKSNYNPVEQVSWYDAVKYCNLRSKIEDRNPCYKFNGDTVTCDFSANGYRLPTEAEWEFAAHGGNASKNYIYSGGDDINEVAWFDKNSDKRTHSVGQKISNELGLYDMTGNVWEYCWDNYYYYPDEYEGSQEDIYCVLRGGSWIYGPKNCLVAKRGKNTRGSKHAYNGFRVCTSR